MSDSVSEVKLHQAVRRGSCLVVRTPAPGQTEVVFVGPIQEAPDFDDLGAATVYLSQEDFDALVDFRNRSLS